MVSASLRRQSNRSVVYLVGVVCLTINFFVRMPAFQPHSVICADIACICSLHRMQVMQGKGGIAGYVGRLDIYLALPVLPPSR